MLIQYCNFDFIRFQGAIGEAGEQGLVGNTGPPVRKYKMMINDCIAMWIIIVLLYLLTDLTSWKQSYTPWAIYVEKVDRALNFVSL